MLHDIYRLQQLLHGDVILSKSEQILEIFAAYLNDDNLIKEESENDGSAKLSVVPNMKFNISPGKSQDIIQYWRIKKPNQQESDAKLVQSMLSNWFEKVPYLEKMMRMKPNISMLNENQTAEILKMMLLTSIKAGHLKLNKGVRVKAIKLREGNDYQKNYGDKYITKFVIDEV
jgi:hypothetical protein